MCTFLIYYSTPSPYLSPLVISEAHITSLALALRAVAPPVKNGTGVGMTVLVLYLPEAAEYATADEAGEEDTGAGTLIVVVCIAVV